MSKEVPNPGSDEALKLGCLCGVMDNNHGAGFAGNFWITGTCPLHGIREVEPPMITE